MLAWVLVAAYAVFAVMLAKTPFGRHLFRIGGNPVASARAGIAVGRNVTVAFILSGVLAGLAGWLLASRTAGDAAPLGIGMLFQAFAAVVIGGDSLKGGPGRLSRVFAGVLLLSSILSRSTSWAYRRTTRSMIRAPRPRRRPPRHRQNGLRRRYLWRSGLHPRRSMSTAPVIASRTCGIEPTRRPSSPIASVARSYGIRTTPSSRSTISGVRPRIGAPAAPAGSSGATNRVCIASSRSLWITTTRAPPAVRKTSNCAACCRLRTCGIRKGEPHPPR